MRVLLYPYQLDPIYYPDTNRSYLNQFFPNRTLVITEHTLYSKETLTHIVNQFDNIEQIVIDVTHNPYNSDELRLKTVYEILAQLAPTIILSGDFSLLHCPRPNFIFFPVFLWAFSQRNPVWYRNVVFDRTRDKTKLLCCFNKSPWSHRIELFLALVDRPWFTQIQYSFGNFDPTKQQYVLDPLSDDQKNKFNQCKDMLPISIDGDTNLWKNDVGISNSAYKECVVNLTTETSANINIFTEKMAKPFMAYQIPIVVAAPNATQFFEDTGLDMFSDIIPWKSWDNIDNTTTRIDSIVNFLDTFIEQDPVLLYDSCNDRLSYNKKYFHSEEFRNILLKQLNEFVLSNIA